MELIANLRIFFPLNSIETIYKTCCKIVQNGFLQRMNPIKVLIIPDTRFAEIPELQLYLLSA